MRDTPEPPNNKEIKGLPSSKLIVILLIGSFIHAVLTNTDKFYQILTNEKVQCNED